MAYLAQYALRIALNKCRTRPDVAVDQRPNWACTPGRSGPTAETRAHPCCQSRRSVARYVRYWLLFHKPGLSPLSPPKASPQVFVASTQSLVSPRLAPLFARRHLRLVLAIRCSVSLLGSVCRDARLFRFRSFCLLIQRVPFFVLRYPPPLLSLFQPCPETTKRSFFVNQQK